jgi:monoterpene epsilon-lactone hydrolase
MLLAVLETLRFRWGRGPLRPSWSFAMELIVRYLRRDWDDTVSWSFPRLRADLDARPYPGPHLRRVRARDGLLGGVAARWFTPPDAASDTALLYFHGGSYLYGSARTTHADLIARLALGCGVTAIGVDYRLAPEHAYPAQLEDALRAYDALAEHGIRRVLVAGDSAGGNLALMLQVRLRELGREQPLASVLICPWSDLSMPGQSFQENDRYDYGTRAALLKHARAFAGELPLDDPRLSPLYADLHGLPPTLVVLGSLEVPRDDILALTNALERSGVEVRRHLAEELPHLPPLFADLHPAGAACVAAIASFVSSCLQTVASPRSRAADS